MNLKEIVQRELISNPKFIDLKQRLENIHAFASCSPYNNYERALFEKIKDISEDGDVPYLYVVREYGVQVCEHIVNEKKKIIDLINEYNDYIWGEKRSDKDKAAYLMQIIEKIHSHRNNIIQDSRSISFESYKDELLFFDDRINLMMKQLEEYTYDDKLNFEWYQKDKKEIIREESKLYYYDYDELKLFKEVTEHFKMMLDVLNSKPFSREHNYATDKLLRTHTVI